MKRSLLELANDQVSIITVCQEIGMRVPDIQEGRSLKLNCPFGRVTHSDGGLEDAFRIYPPPSNTAFCFAGCGLFTPVWLFAQANDISSYKSAQRLLDLVGYVPKRVTWESASAVQQLEPNQFDLASALKVYCSRVDPSWEERQFDPGVAATLTRCLEIIPYVSAGEGAKNWLEKSKRVMSRVLSLEGVK